MKDLQKVVAIITGDIINSTQSDDWNELLNKQLELLGKSPKDYVIYRGDGFQIRNENPRIVLTTALKIKTAILQNKNTDVRLAIGIGKEEKNVKNLNLNNGEAYIKSGRLLELKTHHLAIDYNEQYNQVLNAGFGLINCICEQWTTGIATVINTKLNFPEMNQQEIADKLETTQSNISRILNRANWVEIQAFIHYFETLFPKV